MSRQVRHKRRKRNKRGGCCGVSWPPSAAKLRAGWDAHDAVVDGGGLMTVPNLGSLASKDAVSLGGSASRTPTLGTLNGAPILAFDGTDDVLDAGATPAIPAGARADCPGWALVAVGSVPGSFEALFAQYVGSSAGRIILGRVATGFLTYWNSSVNRNLGVGALSSPGVFGIRQTAGDTGRIYSTADGAAVNDLGVAFASIAADGNLLGAYSTSTYNGSPTQFLSGVIGTVLVYENLSEAEWLAAVKAAGARWGLL